MAYIILPSNIAQQTSKGVDLTNVTQAASGSPLFNRGGNAATAQPSFQGGGNPSTSLSNAGSVSKMGQTFADYGAKNGTIPIQGPGGSGGPSQPPVWSGPSVPSGMPAVQDGGGDTEFGQLLKMGGSRNPVQESRYQQLIKEFLGSQVLPPAPNTPTAFLPSFTPPPTPTPSATLAPKSASGATTMPGSLSTGGGTSGMAFQAPTALGNAVKGLQNITSLPASVIGNLVSSLQKFSSAPAGWAPAGAAQQSITDAGTPAGWSTTDAAGNVKAVSQNEIEQSKQLEGMVSNPINAMLPGLAEKTGLSLLEKGAQTLPDIWKSAQPLMKKLPVIGAAGGATALGATASAPKQEAAYNLQTQRFGSGTQGGEFQNAPKGQTSATPQNILGNVKSPDAIARAVVSGLQNPKQVENVIAGIASEEAKPIITSMINSAAKRGDMDTVHQLIGMLNGVQRQINFNDMIQQAAGAIAGGFGGVPPAPQAAQRLPMVQQAFGSALEGPVLPPSGFNQESGSQIPYLPTNLQTASPTQQNRPILNPFMGA